MADINSMSKAIDLQLKWLARLEALALMDVHDDRKARATVSKVKLN